MAFSGGEHLLSMARMQGARGVEGDGVGEVSKGLDHVGLKGGWPHAV